MKKLSLLIIFSVALLFPIVVKAETFTWPSDGYLGWRYYQNTNGQEGINGTYHTGIDIWSNADGGWNNDVVGSSNPVYPAYQGSVVYVDSLGIIIKHSNSLYTKYWHIRNRKVSVNNSVNTISILGYQDYASAVHVHVTVASSASGGDASNTLDPSDYFGVELDVRKSNVAPWGYHVTHGCGGSEVTISNQDISNLNCSANNSIKIYPNVKIYPNSRFFIQ